MANNEIKVRIKSQYKTSTEWTSLNPVLLKGEIAISSDLRMYKVGDGTTAWNNLKYNNAEQSNKALTDGNGNEISTTYFKRNEDNVLSGDNTFTGYNQIDVGSITDLTVGNMIVNGSARFNNGLIGDLTGNADTATLATTATTANKLGTNAGSGTNPVYFADGIPKACSYTLGTASQKAYVDSSSASAIGTSTNLVTERDVYYGLPTINGGHSYTSSTNLYAPVTSGTSSQVLTSSGGVPVWANQGDLSVGNSSTMDSYTTSSTDTMGRWTVNIPNITKLYDGLTIRIKLSTSYNSTYNTLNINNLGEKLVWYRYNTRFTSHLGTNSELVLTYRTKAGSYTSGSVTYTDGWILSTSYYSDGNYNSGYLYYRPYAGVNGLKPYKFFGIDANGKAEAFTIENSTGTTKTVTTVPLDIKKGIFYFNTSGTISANSVTSSQCVYNIYCTSNSAYTFNSTLTAYKEIYLKGTLDQNDLFKLDNTTTTSWYIQVPYDTTYTPANYFSSSYVYVLLGYTYSSNNYLQLIEKHPIYKFDGEKLIEQHFAVAKSAKLADTATTLSSNAGSTTQPIYFKDGKPTATTYALNATVPSGAKFTDTIYTHPTTSGNKHIPSGGSSGQILRWSSDGTAVWGADNNTTYTLSSFGITSTASELNVLDGITASTTELNYVKGVTNGIQGQLDSKLGATANAVSASGLSITNSNEIRFTNYENNLSTLYLGYKRKDGDKTYKIGNYSFYDGQTNLATVTASSFLGSLNGNANTSTKLQTARTISLTGSVTGSGSFDGSSNLNIITTTNHTHNYLPLTGGQINGDLFINTNSGDNALNISRIGNSGENVRHYVDDNSYHINYTNDENLSLIQVTLNNTDTESGGGANATNKTFIFNSDGTLISENFKGKLTGDVVGNISGSSGSCTGNAATATSASSCTGNSATATTLQNTKTIFGKDFNGSDNVTGQATIYGTYTVASGRYNRSGLRIRENDLVTNTQLDIGYAPSIGFYWYNVKGATLAMASNGEFQFINEAGTAYSNLRIGALNATSNSTISGILNTNGGIQLPDTGGSWIHGMTETKCIVGSPYTSSTGSTYHPVIRQNTALGNVFNIGGITNGSTSDVFGIYTFKSGRTENSFDSATLVNAIDGSLSHTGALNIGGSTTLNSTLNVSGESTFTGKTTHKSGIDSTYVKASSYISANSGSSATSGGLALYGSSPTSYGIAMRTSSDGGTHGYNIGDWNTYFYMNGGSETSKRGWIYRNSSKNVNVASISQYGDAQFDGKVRIGGNSGCEIEYKNNAVYFNFT